MPLTGRITTRRSGPTTVTKSARRAALRGSMEHLGKAAHRIVAPNKFKRSASRRYGHLPRGRRYVLAKIARKTAGGERAIGDPTDFVWSGRSKQSVLNNRRFNATAKSSTEAKVDVLFIAPQLNQGKLEDGTSIRREFERDNPEETDLLFRLAHRDYLRRLRRAERNSRRSKKV